MARLGEQKASERRIAAADKQRQALELKKSGLDYRAIAERLGYSLGGAHKAVQTGLRATLQEPADELRQLEARRLDQMLMGLWPRAIKGDVHAIDRVLKIMQRRAALLGLDAPAKKELSGSIEFRHYAEQVASELDLDVGSVIAQAELILSEAAQ